MSHVLEKALHISGVGNCPPTPPLSQHFALDAKYVLIGTLRSDNGDVHENVAEKQTSPHLKLFHDYPNSPCYAKEGDFGWR